MLRFRFSSSPLLTPYVPPHHLLGLVTINSTAGTHTHNNNIINCTSSTTRAVSSKSTTTAGTSPPSSSSSKDSQQQGTTTPPPPPLLPHPRVRELYKELILLAHQHPTFPMSKCRTKIKSYFDKNRDIAVYSDGSKYTGGGRVTGHATTVKKTTESGETAEETVHVEGDLTDDHHNHSSLQHHQHQHHHHHAHTLPVNPYSDRFKRALAWGRYHQRELEALIHLHKYRTMKRRYSWGADEEAKEVEMRVRELEHLRRSAAGMKAI